MKKKTLELNDTELNEWCAKAQWWELNKYKSVWMLCTSENKVITYTVDEYQPTADTVEGKAQCLQLMDKFKMSVDFEEGEIVCKKEGSNSYVTTTFITYDNHYLKAACLTVVLSVFGDEVEV